MLVRDANKCAWKRFITEPTRIHTEAFQQTLDLMRMLILVNDRSHLFIGHGARG